MKRTIKYAATLFIAIVATAGAASQTAAFAVAGDSHTPVVGAYVTTATSGAQGEGHSPVESPR
ncbi:hypothetical protein [Streptomyces sp. NPDC005322]|uniref:hypothetical protein n=1 Tax=unclassified Streptomyces TaxID=2593676 RepID=UPI0033A1FEED